jgi:hypothetical protein
MKITGCRVNYGPSAKKELFELLPRSIERMVNNNDDQSFDFKIELPIGNRVTSSIKSFGPDFQGTDDFEMLKGKVLPVIGNRKIVAFGIKFNEDGIVSIVPVDEIPSNEGALPRESTVKQLQKIRKATKSTTIDDRVTKLKGANLGSEKNFIDSGIESYENFQKKNKSFIPSWNLKHLKSPFKASVKNEGIFDFFKKKSNGLHSTDSWTEQEKEQLQKAGFKFIDTLKTNSTTFGYFDFNGYFLIKSSVNRSGSYNAGYEESKYQLIKNDRIQKTFTDIDSIIKWKNRNLGPHDIKFQNK